MRFFFVALICFFAPFTHADSPITSTDIANSYKEEALVKKALESDGKLTDEFCDFIFNKKNELGVRVAIINALSWNFNGKNNFDIAFNYLMKNKKIKSSNYMKKLKGDDLVCLAYIKVMDNYFTVDEALSIAEAAKSKMKNSYTAHIIYALIKAQSDFDKDWCDCWKVCNEVRINKALVQDMKVEAQNSIFEYMDLYKEYCK
ncbi:MAG: hypothetical protein R2799_06675 [Crocinitomicaceae bacterium]